ncbi:hypothetical protein llap_2468 [Limosa lapponica baueri]|uniref:Uncharacterized protein n=1 Tax=Limosa lapponica baueri TaxID=1758121 RepID=A0A2I0UMG7_LIMLA|nr:hypothetical protein llap_2468 [Limosa lapponica baueri]
MATSLLGYINSSTTNKVKERDHPTLHRTHEATSEILHPVLRPDIDKLECLENQVEDPSHDMLSRNQWFAQCYFALQMIGNNNENTDGDDSPVLVTFGDFCPRMRRMSLG